MSFTAGVKDEASRIESKHQECNIALLSAIVHTEGSLYFLGKGRYRVEIATDNACVARVALKLLHESFALATELTVRKSVLHKTRNYLISLPDQPQLSPALKTLGILDERGIELGVDQKLVKKRCCAASYLRGVFLGSGFIADPMGDFHFEITCSNEAFAEDLISLMGRFDIPARYVRRRNLYVLYLKSVERIIDFVNAIGAHKSALQIEEVRVVKSVRNDINRRVNAELANSVKASYAGDIQVRLIKRVESKVGLDNLPPALQQIARLRMENPEASLRELGELADPPLSKSAVAHRMRRLEELAEH